MVRATQYAGKHLRWFKVPTEEVPSPNLSHCGGRGMDCHRRSLASDREGHGLTQCRISSSAAGRGSYAAGWISRLPYRSTVAP